MSTVRSGDITQFTIGGRELAIRGEASVTIRISGFTSESAPTGNGELHTRRNRKLGGFESLPVSVDAAKGDLEYLQGVADKAEAVPVTMTLATGKTYSGALAIEGALDYDTAEGQVELSAVGPRFEVI